MSVMQSDC